VRPVCLVLVLAFLAPSACSSPSSVEPAALTVEVVGQINGRQLRVRFSNHGVESLRIVRPMDGSEHGWISPAYDVGIVDGNGKPYPMMTRCKLFGEPFSGTRWPEDYVVEVKPGEHVEILVWVSFVLPETGTYPVSFSYSYDPARTKWRVTGGAWEGTVHASPTKVRLSRTT